MAKGEIVFKVDGPDLRGVIQSKSISTDYKGNLFERAFGVVPVPMAHGLKSINIDNNYSLGISQRSVCKEEAWELIKFLLKDESSIKNYLIPSGYIPSIRSTIDNNAVEFNTPFSQAFITDIIPQSRSINYSPKFYESSMIIIDGMNKILSGADTTLLCEEINTQLRQLFNE